MVAASLSVRLLGSAIHHCNLQSKRGCLAKRKEVGDSGTTRKTKDSGRKDTVAVPELRRIQEPHRVFLTGDDVFAQVRFPN